jgi:EpsI family protein
VEADSPSPSRPESTPAARRRPGGAGLLAVLWLVGTGLLALLAYGELFRIQPRAEELSEELEIWLLMPSQTSAAIVAAMSGWLLYRRRQRLAALDPRAGPHWLTALLLGLGGVVFAWGTYTGAADLLAFSLMASALGIGNLFWGTPGLRALGLPVGFLVFAVPMPAALLNAIVFRFQLWTADLTGLLLYLIGLPAFVAGDQILREGDSFTIVEGCSGMRSVETLTMLSVLMVDLFRRRGWHAVLLVAVAPVLAFFLNGWRAVFLMLNPLSGTTLIHNAQGIAILLAGVLLIFLLDGLLARLLPDAAPGPGQARPQGQLGWRRALAATASFGVLAALAQWMPVWQPPAAGIPRLEGRVPLEVGGWRGTDLDTNYYVFLGRTGFGQTLERRYRRGTEAVDLFVGETDHRDRLRNGWSPKTIFPGSGWIVEEAGTQPLAAIGRDVDYRVLRSGTRRILVYHWRTEMQGLAGEVFRSLVALDQSPLRRSRHAVVVRVTTELGAPSIRNRQAAEKRLEDFSEAIWVFLSPLGTAGKSFPVFSAMGKAFP